MSKRDKNGTALRAHLRQIAKTTGKAPAELRGPPLPERAAYLWEMFLDVHQGRTSTESGPSPLTWESILAWDTLTHADLQEWEVRVIKALDAKWLQVVHED
jgi:hypothetical protein